MDGQLVGKAIGGRVRPLLREAGFTMFSGRNAWRRTQYTIDHVVFASFSAQIADAVGCTPYSFSGGAGVYYQAQDPSLERPRDYQMMFRGILGKTIRQPFFRPWGNHPTDDRNDRPDVWYVLPDGSNLAEVVEDAAAVILGQGLPFVDQLNIPERALEFVLNDPLKDPAYGEIGFLAPGAIDSPARRTARELLTSVILGGAAT